MIQDELVINPLVDFHPQEPSQRTTCCTQTGCHPYHEQAPLKQGQECEKKHKPCTADHSHRLKSSTVLDGIHSGMG